MKTSGIPEFPESRSIEITDKKAFDYAFSRLRQEISEFTFTNLYLWGKARSYKLSSLSGHMIVWYEKSGETRVFSPIGPEPAKVIAEIFGKKPEVIFISVPEEVAKKINASGVDVVEDRDNFDYVYNREDLAKLEGAKYYPKRSFAQKAFETYSAKVVDDAEPHVEDFIKFQKRWCDIRGCDTDEMLSQEAAAINALFKNKMKLGARCIGIEVEGRIVAFAIGEPLNDDTFVVHFEKADTRYKGMYQLVNQEFAKRVPAQFRFINREQDIGIEGLRKAKESYYPASMVKKFIVKR